MAGKLVACIFIPHWRAHVARQQRGDASARPLVVATHRVDRAVIVDRCEHAAALGVQVGMLVGDARRRFPTLEVVAVDAGAAAQAAERVTAVLHEHADVVEHPASGCWTLPLVALGAHFSRAPVEAERLRQAVSAGTALPCTVGVGASASIARIAAASAYHDGAPTAIVLPGTEPAFLAPLPLDILPGVGPRTLRALQRLGIVTVGQLAAVPVDVLVEVCGVRGRSLALQARGRGPDGTPAGEGAISETWHTQQAPCADRRRLDAQLYTLVAQVGRELRARCMAAGMFAVRLTWADGTPGQRSVRFNPRRDLDRELARGARTALQELLRERRLAVAQVAVAADDLGPRQHELFTGEDSRLRRLQDAVDAVTQRWGPAAILPGSLLGLTTAAPLARP